MRHSCVKNILTCFSFPQLVSWNATVAPWPNKVSMKRQKVSKPVKIAIRRPCLQLKQERTTTQSSTPPPSVSASSRIKIPKNHHPLLTHRSSFPRLPMLSRPPRSLFHTISITILTLTTTTRGTRKSSTRQTSRESSTFPSAVSTSGQSWLIRLFRVPIFLSPGRERCQTRSWIQRAAKNAQHHRPEDFTAPPPSFLWRPSGKMEPRIRIRSRTKKRSRCPALRRPRRSSMRRNNGRKEVWILLAHIYSIYFYL